VRDISETGARIDQAHALTVGATVLVSLGELEAIGATVIWTKLDSAGLKFVEPIDPEAARSKTVVRSKSRTPL